jgi:hypothetical protein
VEKAAPAVNQLPAVNISTPGNTRSFIAPATVTLTADATDADGTVIKVEYFNGIIKIGESHSAPYQVQFECTTAGEFDITAVATDNLNGVTSSTVLKVSFSFKKEYPDLINLFPNPNYGRFSIDYSDPLPDAESFVTIISLTGQTVYNGMLAASENTRQFDLSGNPSGQYILVITSEDRIVTTKKFIKN